MTTKVMDPEAAAIVEAAADYYGGWYAADPARMERCLHPDLVKRAIRRDQNGQEFLHNLTKAQMVAKTEEGGGSDTPQDQQRYEITLLDRYEEIACVKVVAHEYVDYLQLARQDGRWWIVNALWTDNRDLA